MNRFFWLPATVLATVPAVLQAEENPQQERRTELIQAHTYARSMERQMEVLAEKFPALRTEIQTTQARWQDSPFARGKRALEEEMLREGGANMARVLAAQDREMDGAIETVRAISTEAEVKQFLSRVDARSKGDIKLHNLRGQLLCYCPKYRERPDLEFLEGFREDVTTLHDGLKITLAWPMSWKPMAPRNPALFQKHVHAYGNGHIHGNLQVVSLEKGVTEEAALKASTLEADRAYFESLGLDLLNFQETVSTSFSITEGTRGSKFKVAAGEGEISDPPARMAVLKFQTFYKGKKILIFFNCPGPAGSPTARERLEKYRPLFQLIANSVKFEG